MSGRLYKRNVRLTLARPRVSGADGYFTQQANAVVIEDPRVTFTIEKHLGSEPNTCAIEVFNLAENSRAAFERKPLHVRLEGGYDGEYARLFVGDLRFGRSKIDGTEWITRLEVGDGERAFNYARVSRSFKAGVDKRTVLEDIAKSMGLKIPKTLDDARELTDQFASGLTLEGPSHKELTRLAKSMGMTWSVQDGTLQVLRSTDVRADRAIVVSESTGMIGSPELGTPKQPGGAPILSVQMLLAPEVTPGGRIKMESRAIRGIFRVERVVHTGDTDPRGPWMTEIEAKAVK